MLKYIGEPEPAKSYPPRKALFFNRCSGLGYGKISYCFADARQNFPVGFKTPIQRKQFTLSILDNFNLIKRVLCAGIFVLYAIDQPAKLIDFLSACSVGRAV